MILGVSLLLSAAARSVALSVSRVRTVVDWGSAEQQARLESLKPLIHVHVPKAGTTFMNVIAEHPGICPNLHVSLTQKMLDQYGDLQADGKVRSQMNQFTCPGGVAGLYFQRAFQHAGLGAFPKESIKGHATIMLRQPEARLLSAFQFNASFLPNYPKQRFHWNISLRGPAPATFKEYAEAMQGGTVKILTRSDSVPGPDQASISIPSMEERDEALRMLKEDFVFVGITEHWDLSVCLFHAMYGGDCGSDEFLHLRANNYPSDAPSIADLNGWRDVYDGALYEEGMKIFNKNLERYNVSEANCPSSCRSTTT